MTLLGEQLDFFLAFFEPLITVEAASDALDGVGKDTILAMLEDGRLRGVDIKHPASEKRCLRVWKYSVKHLMISGITKPVYVPVERLIPSERKIFLFTEAARFMACTDKHVQSLCNWTSQTGEHLITGPRYGDRTKRLFVESFVKFLEGRQLS